MTITSGRVRAAEAIASWPLAASPTTSMSSSPVSTMRKPVRTSSWSSTSSTRMLMAPARPRSAGWPPRESPSVVGWATSVPRSIATRSRIPTRPRPSWSGSTAGRGPSPRSSSIEMTSRPGSNVTTTWARPPWACLSELVSASWMMRYADSSRPGSSRRRSPSTDSSTGSPAERTSSPGRPGYPGRASVPAPPPRPGRRACAACRSAPAGRSWRSTRAPTAPRPGASRWRSGRRPPGSPSRSRGGRPRRGAPGRSAPVPRHRPPRPFLALPFHEPGLLHELLRVQPADPRRVADEPRHERG